MPEALGEAACRQTPSRVGFGGHDALKPGAHRSQRGALRQPQRDRNMLVFFDTGRAFKEPLRRLPVQYPEEIGREIARPTAERG